MTIFLSQHPWEPGQKKKKRQKRYNENFSLSACAPGSTPRVDAQHRLGGGEGVRKTRAMVFGGGLTDSKRPLQGLKYKVSIKVQIGDDEHTAVWSRHPLSLGFICAPCKSRVVSLKSHLAKMQCNYHEELVSIHRDVIHKNSQKCIMHVLIIWTCGCEK